jgi:hypothetical protein
MVSILWNIGHRVFPEIQFATMNDVAFNIVASKQQAA